MPVHYSTTWSKTVLKEDGFDMAGSYPRIGLDELRGNSVKELDDAYWCNRAGQKLYSWWCEEDCILVEEILNAARRKTTDDLSKCGAIVGDLLGEKGIQEARKIAEFRAFLLQGIEVQ